VLLNDNLPFQKVSETKLGNTWQLVIYQQSFDKSTHPICSTISLACLIMFAPVWQTMPAISMEYHLAL